jgi:hypothetical protein
VKKMIAVLAVLMPLFAYAGASRDVVTTSKIASYNPSRYWVHTASGLMGNSSVISYYVYPHDTPARLVDVVFTQTSAGVGGTSWTLNAQDLAGTSMFTTNVTGTLASGIGTAAAPITVDSKGVLALPTGWTRPVLKTDSSVIFTKGRSFRIFATESGTYSTHAFVNFVFIFEPLY